jgi:ACS family glucarate transporter-like MFS transporter
MPFEGRNPVARPVIFFCVTLAIFTSMDRAVLSLARDRIARDLKLSDVQMGLVFGAFTIAYAFCETPSGLWGDRKGPQGVMTRVALWWAFFMAATSRVFGFGSLYLSQFLFGAGASGVYPSINRSFATFLGPRERSRAQGMTWLGARWGGASTPIVMAILFRFMDWQAAFLCLSGIGVLWALGFLRWFPKAVKVPASAPAESIPWGHILRSPTIWLLCGQYFALVFPWFFLVTWLPAFVDERFHPDVAAGAFLKLLPLLFGGIGAFAGGFAASPLAHRVGTLGRARKILAIVGCGGASACLLLAAAQHQAVLGVGLVAMASLSADLVMPTAWATAGDIAGRWAGTISGLMNLLGNLGGALFGFTTGVILQTTSHNWNYVLFMNAAMYLLCIGLWLMLDSERAI